MEKGLRTALGAAFVAVTFGASVACSPSSEPQQPASSVITTQAATYAQLDQQQLIAALLTVSDLPTGFSVGATETEQTNPSFYCNYADKLELPKYTEYARRDYSKGTGIQSTITRTGLSQYSSNTVAKTHFDALVETMKTCTDDTVKGERVKHSVVSSSPIGEGSIVIKTEGSISTYSSFALVGPTLVQASAGALTGTDPDVTTELLTKQAERYQEAASE